MVGVGGNLGDDRELRDRFRDARDRLAARPYAGAVTASPIYRSDPVGPVRDQPRFLNAVLAFEPVREVSPVDLLADLLAIEASLGRDRGRGVAGGPRSIDLDLLLVGGRCLAVEGPPALSLPHPRLRQRGFVLRPLSDLFGHEFVVPGPAPRSVGALLASPDVAAQGLERVTADWD